MIDTVRLVLREYELNEPISFLEEVGARIKIDKYKRAMVINWSVGWIICELRLRRGHYG